MNKINLHIVLWFKKKRKKLIIWYIERAFVTFYRKSMFIYDRYINAIKIYDGVVPNVRR